MVILLMTPTLFQLVSVTKVVPGSLIRQKAVLR